MYLEIWMIVVLAVMSGIWGEYRARMGWYDGREDIIKKYQGLIQEAMTTDAQKEREHGAAACLVNLMTVGLIVIDEKGDMIGANGKKLTLKEAEALKAAQDVINRHKETT